ncbi:MAG: peptidoglycan DD-metalloendopeptidase family protein [Bacteroidales bacterium]|jgi:murein DD-endopeptidase MepM/ murein hydrolase activator NlpD|nr:peptidoglycan DD-metalloendopeptidase family protein [Bacteroidales bacterium]
MKYINIKNILLIGLPLIIAVVATAILLKLTKKEPVVNENIEIEIETPTLKYGIPVDSFILNEGTVANNQYLSQILNNYGVSLGKIDSIAKKSLHVFDVRKIKTGQKYTVFQTTDSLKKAQYFVYENSPVEFFVFELFDSLRIYRGEKEVQTVSCIASGTIKSSLWNAMKDNNLDPMLAIDLSNIYAWTIDFFAIQKGDRFRVAFDEIYVDSVRIGIGEIHAAEFEHYSQPHYAFRFMQNDSIGFFDDKGENLQKQFLKAPLNFSRISSGFSSGRMHPVLRIRRPHYGVDYAAPKGTPVVSIGEGTVIAKAYEAAGGGYYLKIKHNSVYTTTYMHLSGYASGIAVGTRVRQGQEIGYVGSTGLSTGPHLDFRVTQNNSYIDPLKMESPPAEPVKQEYMPLFYAYRDSMMNKLEEVHPAEENVPVKDTAVNQPAGR